MPFAVGFTLERLSAHTVDEKGDKAFVTNNPMELLRKVRPQCCSLDTARMRLLCWSRLCKGCAWPKWQMLVLGKCHSFQCKHALCVKHPAAVCYGFSSCLLHFSRHLRTWMPTLPCQPELSSMRSLTH